VSYPQSAYLDPTLTGPGTRSFWWRFTNSSFASGSLAVSIVGTNQSSLTNHYGNPNASAVVTINPSAPWLITQAPSPTWWLELEVARALGVPSLSLGSFCRLACLLSSAPSCSG
jgi:hypothetical protein